MRRTGRVSTRLVASIVPLVFPLHLNMHVNYGSRRIWIYLRSATGRGWCVQRDRKELRFHSGDNTAQGSFTNYIDNIWVFSDHLSTYLLPVDICVGIHLPSYGKTCISSTTYLNNSFCQCSLWTTPLKLLLLAPSSLLIIPSFRVDDFGKR